MPPRAGAAANARPSGRRRLPGGVVSVDDDRVDRPAPEVPPEKSDDSPAEASADPPSEPAPEDGGFAWITDLPKVGFIVGVISLILTAAGTAIAVSQLGGGSSATHTGGSSKPISTSGSRPSSDAEAPSPLISSDATCADFTSTAARSDGHRVLVDSPGEIDGGADVRSRVLPSEEFSAVSRVMAGDEVEIKSLLHNGNYTAADGVSVSASISTYQAKCWRVMERVRVQSFPGDTPRLGPALILLEHGGKATLEYVPGSTQLMDEQGNPLATDLSDGVTQGGIRLPYAVPGGTAYFLSFRVRVRSRERHISPSSWSGRQLSPSIPSTPRRRATSASTSAFAHRSPSEPTRTASSEADSGCRSSPRSSPCE